MTAPTYDLRCLLAAMGMTLSQAQPVLGIGGPEYRRYQRQGLSREVAERKAIKAGLHPYEVWPEMVEHDASSLPVCAAEDCTNTFVGCHRQKYCSDRCRDRQKARRWRRSEKGKEAGRRRRQRPEVAERNRRSRRRYYWENADYERARQRQYEARKRAAS